MSCETCGHTMEGIKPGLFWCPRCGTIRWPADPEAPDAGVAIPKLVERCREFEKRLPLIAPDTAKWYCLGIAESINKPEDRRPA